MKNILIVDDEKFVRLGIKTMIMRAELCQGEIIESKNGKEAVEELQKNEFDLIITDIKMPIMTGIELITKIKEEKLSSAKIVMISGYDEFEYAVSALRMGAADYLLKPIERETFLELLQKIDNQREEELLKDVKSIEIGEENEDKTQKIQRAIEYINQNYSQNINMALVSNEVSMNYTFFSETFKEIVGESFVDYLKSIRINMAKKLLRSSNMPISKVSEEVGFNDEKHFSKTFKSLTGSTPSDYRKTH